MKRGAIKDACRQELAAWRAQMVDDHALPFLCIGKGRDHKDGEIFIYLSQDIPDELLAAFLQQVLDNLDNREQAAS